MIDQQEEEDFLSSPEAPFSGSCPECSSPLEWSDYEFQGEEFTLGYSCPSCRNEGVARYKFTFIEYKKEPAYRYEGVAGKEKS